MLQRSGINVPNFIMHLSLLQVASGEISSERRVFKAEAVKQDEDDSTNKKSSSRGLVERFAYRKT